ncbi:hypothetical protein RX880_07945 [Pseudomonas syringae pv. actinidiae]|nr:hypothetical protein [Pseudomonas syringae pv. actinidiae]MDU8099214.1 hypothetical protein [Pseudomonas syringae pv. actinidiae]MDU8115738.1 hypothetical protein [Pseudomonas syringae pv. actinidiae]MDU8131834.1 hypothetical protein [Pseudomonas syringae pv. actinidiae]MDU8153136.1 hypothetical protein [Pseudomonas syringae pv. actinidiae]
MKSFLLFFILLFPIASYSAEPEPSQGSISGCGIVNNKIIPNSMCIASTDLNAVTLFRLFPTMLQWIPLDEFKESDIANSGNSNNDEDRLNSLKESENLALVAQHNVISFTGIGQLVLTFALIIFALKKLRYGFDTWDINHEFEFNPLIEILKAGSLIFAIIPAFSGYSAFSVIVGYCAVIGFALSNMVYSSILSFKQNTNSITDVTNIEKYMLDDNIIKRNENFGLSKLEFENLITINVISIRDENYIRNFYPDAVIDKTVSVSQKSMLNRNFTAGNTYTIRADDIVSQSGTIEPNFININNLDSTMTKYAIDITYANIIEQMLSTLSIENTEPVWNGWLSIESKLNDELKNLETARRIAITRGFIDHYFNIAYSSLLVKSQMDNKTYSSAFDAVNNKARESAIKIVAADCIRDQSYGYSNAVMELDRSNPLRLCGSYDDNGVYTSLIQDETNTKASLVNDADTANAKVIMQITKAKLQIEQMNYKANMAYQSYDKWAEIRKLGSSHMANALAYASRNGIAQSVANMRHSIKITPATNDGSYLGMGNALFNTNLKTVAKDNGLRQTIAESLKSSEPLVATAEYSQANASSSYISSRVQSTNSNDMGSLLQMPTTTLSNTLGIPKTAKFDAIGVYSCFTTPNAETCPEITVDYSVGMNDFATSMFDQNAKLFALGLAASFTADIASSIKDNEFRKDVDKKNREELSAKKNGGKMSFSDKDQHKKDSSNAKTKNKIRNANLIETGFGYFGSVVMWLASIGMTVSWLTKTIITCLPYGATKLVTCLLFMMIVYYVICGPIILLFQLAKNDFQSALGFSKHTALTITFLPVVLAMIGVIANSLMNAMFIVFSVFLLAFYGLMDAVSGSQESLVTQFLGFVIWNFMTMAFLGIVLFKFIIKTTFVDWLNEWMKLIVRTANGDGRVGELAQALLAGTGMAIRQFTANVKAGNFRSRKGRMFRSTKQSERHNKTKEHDDLNEE